VLASHPESTLERTYSSARNNTAAQKRPRNTLLQYSLAIKSAGWSANTAALGKTKQHKRSREKLSGEHIPWGECYMMWDFGTHVRRYKSRIMFVARDFVFNLMDGATAGEGGQAGPNYDDSDSEDEVCAPGCVCLQSICFCVCASIQ